LWNVLTERERKTALNDPEYFLTRMLGYDMKPFHRRWFEFQKSHKRTLILAPRGHGKTTVCNIAYSLWRLLDDRERRVFIVSSTAEQAEAIMREIRQHLERNPALQMHLAPRKGPLWRSNQLYLPDLRRLSKEASVTATGVFGPVITRHYDLIVLDDVVDEETAFSQHMRERLFTWFHKVLAPCLEPDGEMHVLGTRYHRDDLYGRLISAAAAVERI